MKSETAVDQPAIEPCHAEHFGAVPVNSLRGPDRYRRDVDGLRAVAVILVILYHLNRSFAPAGFVGVDIFFVISGFVVTGSILAYPVGGRLQAMGHFWRRRVLRILPPLLLMVLVSSIAIAMFVPPFPTVNYNSSFRTGLSAILGLGNYYLYKGKLDYFTADQSTNPFVHTWSLGVEEQFYFLFALLFIGAIGLSRRRMQLGISIVVIAALGMISYGAFLRTGAVDASMAYYFIAFRFWEITVGSLLCCCDIRFHGHTRPKHDVFASSVQIVALFTITASIWFYRTDAFPSFQISAAVASTALLIATGKGGSGFISRILSRPIFVQVGLISYSLYLWHYPILLFWRANFGLNQFVHYLLVLSAMLIVATLSYRAVELTIRRSTLSFSRVLLPGLVLVVIVGFGSAWLFQQHPGAVYLGSKQLWSQEWVPLDNHPYSGGDRILGSACKLGDGSAVPAMLPDKCSTIIDGSAASTPTLLVVGDSHAFADWGMAAFGAGAGAYRFATLTHDGCWIGAERSKKSASCRTYWERMPTLVGNTLRRNDSLLIAVLWQSRTAAEIVRATESIAIIARAARDIQAEVIVEAPLPVFEKPPYLCTREWYRINYTGCSVDRSDIERGRGFVVTHLRTLVSGHKNMRIWDPLLELCPTPVCSPFKGGKPIFRDQNHLSYYGSTSLGPIFVGFFLQDRTTLDGGGSLSFLHL